jgi:hypothetical protein
MLKQLIGFCVDNLKQEIVIFVGGKIGLNHLGATLILLII